MAKSSINKTLRDCALSAIASEFRNIREREGIAKHAMAVRSNLSAQTIRDFEDARCASFWALGAYFTGSFNDEVELELFNTFKQIMGDYTEFKIKD